MTRVVLATTNPGKVREVARILDGLDVDLVPMGAVGLEPVEETGETFEANALLKARAAATGSGLPALADDSGLEVDALGGAPGVRSARYAGDDADDEANNRRLLADLAEVEPAARTGRFVCVAALATPDGRVWTARGEMPGVVLTAPRGSGGFGYDPLFVAVGETGTNAELAPDVKDARSHRGQAFRALRADVATALADHGA